MKIFISFIIFTSIITSSIQSIHAMGMAPVSGGQKATCMAMTPQCMGNSSGTRPGQFCYNCQYMSQPNWGFNMVPYRYPWWHSYGQYSYPNYNRPGVWQRGGLSQNYYPGPGNIVAGKPNLYIHGSTEETRFQIKFKGKSNLLAASPIHSKDGWLFKTKNKKITVDGVAHDYLYYDYKLDSNTLQNEKGFCGDRTDIYKKMVSTLNQMQFKDKEITDFEEFWSLKLPKGNFCVYPQSHDDLQKSAQWNSSVAPAYFKRVLFVVIPSNQIETGKSASFKKRPNKGWNPLSAVYRLPSSKGALQIHEWGVAFLAK